MKKLKEIYKGSVLDLSRFSNKSFEVVLNLGSYYHLCNKDDRKKSIDETLRVLKPGGIYMISYINRYANYLTHFEEFKHDFDFLERYIESGHIDDSSLFYATNPEMIEEELSDFPLQQLHNVATDGPTFFYKDVINEMKDKEFKKIMNLHIKLCHNMSNLGNSEHGLIIARKI